jgi:hypothetical protein
MDITTDVALRADSTEVMEYTHKDHTREGRETSGGLLLPSDLQLNRREPRTQQRSHQHTAQQAEKRQQKKVRVHTTRDRQTRGRARRDGTGRCVSSGFGTVASMYPTADVLLRTNALCMISCCY